MSIIDFKSGSQIFSQRRMATEEVPRIVMYMSHYSLTSHMPGFWFSLAHCLYWVQTPCSVIGYVTVGHRSCFTYRFLVQLLYVEMFYVYYTYIKDANIVSLMIWILLLEIPHDRYNGVKCIPSKLYIYIYIYI